VLFMPNKFYPNEDAYVAALADALRDEYEAIWKAGFVLQIDCPDLAMSRHLAYTGLSLAEFRRIAARNVEAINHATRNIPADAMRMHLCWGNYAGPHTHDVPLKDVADLVFNARPRAVLFEAANPRHAHEWEDLKSARIPDDKILVPGVIDTNTNHVEHAQLVAQRIEAFAAIVGRERVMAGTDCGFGTFAKLPPVYPSIAWEKLKSLVAGARLASERLW
jgi:5-methyltetrahydropteroyltriglutamate--homocysteine methyltransferase